jgi:hypothetical protein
LSAQALIATPMAIVASNFTRIPFSVVEPRSMRVSGLDVKH